jgi:hypothetical protein
MGNQNEISFGGNRYAIIGPMRRVQINDWPRPTPSSGAQDVGSRYLRNQLIVKDIVDAFAHQVELRWEDHVRDGVTIINHLANSECWTHQGRITKARREVNPAFPSAAGYTWVAGGFSAPATRPSASPSGILNPRMPKFFQGSSNSGVFVGMVDDVAQNDYDIQMLRWGGTAWTKESLLTTSGHEEIGVLDIEEHKGAIHAWYVNSTSGAVESTATGASFSPLTNSPTGGFEGSRLLNDGNRLFAFVMNTNGFQFDIESTDDDGGTAWVSGLSNAAGQIRDVGFYFDRDQTSRIVVLTESALYWLDTTTQNALVLNKIRDLPARGRAMTEYGGELIIFMDQMRVIGYSANGVTRNLSPGGVQGMPSGKDFGSDVKGTVCIVRTDHGIYALWSGMSTDGGGLVPLILLWTGFGWHFIWKFSEVSISSSARFIAFDPVSGDLLAGIQDSVQEDTTSIQIKDVEATVDRLGSNVEFKSTDDYFELPRLEFGSPALSTTLWDCFLNTDDVDATETIQHKYGIDGAVSTDQNMGTVTADDGTFTYPVSGSAGQNCRTFQPRFILASGGTALSPKIVSISFSYLRVPDVRWIYSFEVSVAATMAMRNSVARGAAIAIRNDLETTLDSKVKVTLAYGDRTGLSVLPIPANELTEDILESLGRARGESQPNRIVVFAAEV